MEEATSKVTIAVIMDHLDCHDVEYSVSKDPFFAVTFSPIVMHTGTQTPLQASPSRQKWRTALQVCNVR